MIVQPEEMNFSDKKFNLIIAGLPGVGKTTLALTAPKPVLVDFDKGVVGVESQRRKATVMADTYEEILKDAKTFRGIYETIILDTGGSHVDCLKDWAMRNEPTASKKSGGFSLPGFGFVKSEYLRFSNELRKDFNVISLFHVTKEKQDDDTFFELVCEGAARTLVWQPADLGAYMFMQNGERWLGFTPTANYNAKSRYGIKGLVKVPELKEGDPNSDFLTRLFAQARQNLLAESASLKPQQDTYKKATAEGIKIIAQVKEPGQVLVALEQIRALDHALTSQKEIEAALKHHAKENGWVYDKEAKAYVAKQAE